MERAGRVRRDAEEEEDARAGGRVPPQPLPAHRLAGPSAREALQTFLAGRGDVLLAYENEAIFANQNNQELPYVIPEGDDPDREPDRGHDALAEQGDRARVRTYLRTTAAQRIFARTATARRAYRGPRFLFPTRPQLFTIKWLGGWAKVDKRFFDPNSGIVTRIQRQTGGRAEHARAAAPRPGRSGGPASPSSRGS